MAQSPLSRTQPVVQWGRRTGESSKSIEGRIRRNAKDTKERNAKDTKERNAKDTKDQAVSFSSAARAADWAASFLLRPSACAMVSPSTTTSTTKLLRWS